MENNKLEKLRTQWKYTGFPLEVFDSMIPEMELNNKTIERTIARDIGDKKAIYTPKVTLGKDQEYYMNDFRLKVEMPVSIVPEVIRGIDIGELDKDMAAHNWNKVFGEVKHPYDLLDDEITERQQRQAIMNRLQTLNLHGTEGAIAAQEKLMVKHFRGTLIAEQVPGFEKIVSKEQFQISSTFPTTYVESYTAKEAFNMMEKRGVYNDIRPNDQMIKKAQNTGRGLTEHYKSWVVIDFTQKKDNGEYMRKYYYKQTLPDLKANGPIFDVPARLAEFPFIDRDNPTTFGRIVDALYKGNVPQVFFPGEEKPQQHTLETNLIPRSLTVKNEAGVMVPHKELGKEKDVEKTSILARHYDTYLEQKKSESQNRAYVRQPKAQVKVSQHDKGIDIG